MHIFLTGGSGYIGSAVLEALVRSGHQVDALVRNKEAAEYVQARGAHPVLGDLGTPTSYAGVAASAQAVVHTALESSPRAPQVDAIALDALLAPGVVEGRVFVYTSGVWVLGNCPTPADETAPLNPAEHSAWRAPHERRVLDAATAGIRSIVVRPGIVYGGSRGIVGDIFKDAANSLVRVIGPGDNHWPLIYDRDLGDLYARLVAHPDGSGVFHANDEGDERVTDIVEAIAIYAPTPPGIRHMPLAEARLKLGTYAAALALDQVIRSPRARALGWSPTLHSVAGNAARLSEEWRRGRDRS